MLLSIAAAPACSLDGLLNSDELPTNVSDPAVTQTPSGARQAYVGTLHQFSVAFGNNFNSHTPFVAVTALLTDELSDTEGTGSLASGRVVLDRRSLPEGQVDASVDVYSNLQKVRGQTGQATGLLVRYLPDQPELAAHLYAIQGYAEVFLAELFCSGIPLSTLDYDGDFTYKPGSTTAEVLAHAVALFDTALALAGDSARFVNLARLGRARALLALGVYPEAATAVAAVPDKYRYDVTYRNADAERNFVQLVNNVWQFSVPNVEGFNGTDWRTSGDPRSQVVLGVNGIIRYYRPVKYAADGSSSIVLAGGIEARLVEAEAALQANPADGQWLAKLNALRTDGTFETRPTTDPNDDPGVTYQHWHAGTGGVDSLPPLDDPVDSEARVDLLFRERGFWLFLTGHRQGDLRRLIREYGRAEGQVYPVGPYRASTYGSDITAPVPVAERTSNTLYRGCISRGA